jgi:hypothetical protein
MSFLLSARLRGKRGHPRHRLQRTDISTGVSRGPGNFVSGTPTVDFDFDLGQRSPALVEAPVINYNQRCTTVLE